MMHVCRVLGLSLLCGLLANTGQAQVISDTATPSTTSSGTPAEPRRPGTTTADGDTGLWFVPTAEVLARGQWSVSAYRVGLNYRQGFTNVASFPLTVGFGLSRRVQLFGAFTPVVRIDRDLRPLFGPDPLVGGLVDRHPLVSEPWSGNQIGDLVAGAKVNLRSSSEQPIGVAIRGLLKLPTASKASGAGTGATDVMADLVVSGEPRQRIDLSAFAGVVFRGAPQEVTQSSGLRYGAGAGFPSRTPFKITAEWFGETPFDSTIRLSRPLAGRDGSLAPLTTPLTSFNALALGLTWQHRSGFFVGGGAVWTRPTANRSAYRSEGLESGDFVDYQFRIGYHPGTRVATVATPPPPPPPPPSPPPPPANRPPTVQASCNPCAVEVGRSATVTALGQDPDGDTLTYRWTAPTGTLRAPAERETTWTAPQVTGAVPVTVTVDDGKGGTARDTIRIQVVQPAPVAQLSFDDIYFDFDRYTLRPEAQRMLDEAVATLQVNPGRNIVIEGHTCNIGSAEYNLALGERRARSVYAYLVSRGVQAARLQIQSYGEERPKFDNSREETRKLNRRSVLQVRVQ